MGLHIVNDVYFNKEKIDEYIWQFETFFLPKLNLKKNK